MRNIESFKVFDKYRGKKWLNNLSMEVAKLKENPDYNVKSKIRRYVIPFTDIERIKVKILEIFGYLIIKIYEEDGYLNVILKLKYTNRCSLILSIKELEDEYFYTMFNVYSGELWYSGTSFVCDQEFNLFSFMEKIKKLIE